jgi:hypothetical protein
LTKNYLLSLGAQCDRIAVLSETGTSFGLAPRDDQKHCAPLKLTFPLHISNLRRAVRSTAGSPMPQLELGHRNLSFSEEQSEAGGYTVPAFSSRATSYDELTLTKLLQTIYRQRMDYVHIEFALWNVRRDPMIIKFDLIVAMDVLYYLTRRWDLRKAARLLVDALLPGGYLLVENDKEHYPYEGRRWADYLLQQCAGDRFPVCQRSFPRGRLDRGKREIHLHRPAEDLNSP